MPETVTPATDTPLDIDTFRGGALAVRSVVGGALMGLANLIPGISGGTMLLAVGVYPQFIAGVAEVSTLRFRPKVVLMLVCVAGAAGVAIVGFAQLVGGLLDQHEWAMYSLFIGLALGGVPILWRMVHPVDRSVVLSAVVAVGVSALLAAVDPERVASEGGPSGTAYAMSMVAGFSGGSAMILPGVSGAYLLLILGQYRPVVEAVAAAADGARTGAWAVVGQTLHVLGPLAIGVAVGVIGVSNIVKRLLATYRRATLGFLLGLLVGAVFGLWPFTVSVSPQVGDVVRGVELTTPAMVAEVDPRYYARVPVAPSARRLGAGAALALLGFGVSTGISRFGK